MDEKQDEDIDFEHTFAVDDIEARTSRYRVSNHQFVEIKVVAKHRYKCFDLINMHFSDYIRVKCRTDYPI